MFGSFSSEEGSHRCTIKGVLTIVLLLIFYHAKAKRTGSAKIRSKFETLRREIKADIRKQHDLYVNNLVGDVKANPRDFYRYINSQKKDTQGIPPLNKRQESGLAQSDFEKASEFNGQFTYVFTKK